MSLLVVDTDVVSYIFKDHPLAASFFPLLQGHQLVISFMTRAELRFGARKAGWGPGRWAALEGYIARYGICFPDAAMCDLWADVTLEAAQQGTPIDSQDGWVAATALYLNAPLVTNNSKHFQGVSNLVLRTPRALA